MTLEQFQSTRRNVPDLGEVLRDEMLTGCPGYMYCNDCLYIEDASEWPAEAPGRGKGRWYTLIGNTEYQSDDLNEIERLLYEFAVEEGYEAK